MGREPLTDDYLVWLVNNDALRVVSTADPSILTPVAVFKAACEDVTHRLAATGAVLLMAKHTRCNSDSISDLGRKSGPQAGLSLSVVGLFWGLVPEIS